MMRRSPWAAALLVLLACPIPAAHGQTPAAAPQGSCELAEEALAASRVDDAEAGFVGCLKVAKTQPERWRSLVMLAAIRSMKGDRLAALAYYRRFIAATARDPEAETQAWRQARRHAAEDAAVLEAHLRASHARVSVTSEPPGATFTVDGTPPALEDAERTPLETFVEPGLRRLELRIEGLVPWTREVTLVAGRLMAVHATLRPPPPPPEPEPAPAPPLVEAPSEDPGRVWRVTGYSLAAAGTLAVAGAAWLTSSAQDDMDALEVLAGLSHLDDSQIESFRSHSSSAQSKERAYWALCGAGAAAITTGVLLLARYGFTETVSVRAGAGEIGLSFSRRW